MNLKKITKKIIIGDTFLNWFLGIVITLFPFQVLGFFTSSKIFSSLIIRGIGFGFILFAGFQTYSILTKIDKTYYLVAMWLAILPVIALTIILVMFNAEIYLVPKIIAWTGNIYMVGISWLYYNMGK